MREHHGTADSGERKLRDLLQAAGKRPRLPVPELARLRLEVKRDWLATYSRSPAAIAMRRLVPLAALIAITLGLLWWAGSRTSERQVVASVERLTGEARHTVGVSPVDAIKRLTEGQTLTQGQTVETGPTDRDGPAAANLRLAHGESLRLDTDSRVKLLAADRIALLRGAVYVDTVTPERSADSLTIETPFAEVRDIGTQYQVRLLDNGARALAVLVREGEVLIDRDDAESLKAVEGQRVILSSQDEARISDIPRYGPEWQWVTSVSPKFAIDKRTLEEFLHWFCRETGIVLRPLPPTIGTTVAQSVLHGSIEDLEPEESLAVVLAGSGLDYRLEEGFLTLVPSTDGSSD